MIDPLSHQVAKVLSLDAVAVTATADAAWVLTRDGSLVRIAEQDSSGGAPIDVGDTGGASLAAGGGAVWVVDAAQGILERYDDPGGKRSEPIDVGAGAGPVARLPSWRRRTPTRCSTGLARDAQSGRTCG